MTETDHISEAIAGYERDFPGRWWGKRGMLKWQVVQRFQRNWNLEAKNFPAMLEAALEGTGPLFPRLWRFTCNETIVDFARRAPGRVKTLFRKLFDESQPLDDRAAQFERSFLSLTEKYDDETARAAFQGPRAASIYLWLHDPERYMPFMQAPCSWVASQYGLKFNKSSKGKLSTTQELYKRFIPDVLKHQSLIAKVKAALTPDCYQEGLERLLALDIADYMSEKAGKKEVGSGGTTAEDQPVAHWWLTADPSKWSFRSMEEGAEGNYSARTDSGKRTRNHFNSLNVGDKLVCFESGRTKAVVAFAVVTHVEYGEFVRFRLERFLPEPVPRAVLKADRHLKGHRYFDFPNQSLFPLTPEQYDAITALAGLEEESGSAATTTAAEPTAHAGEAVDGDTTPTYGKDDFLSEVFWDERLFTSIRRLLERKKNIILQGAPGVGKTFAARRLAYAMMGCKDDTRLRIIQFHQSYSYEDFVLGYKPHEDKFRQVKGVFYSLCEQAAGDPERPYFLLIDEINRGYLGKIFGELLMLIETGYRGTCARLAGSDKDFSVPENLYIIGMMNTADRSLALMDYALRRRFGFCTLAPALGSEGFRKACAGVWGHPVFQAVLGVVRSLNTELEEKLGKGYCIGHSFLCPTRADMEEPDIWLEQLVEYDLLPLLEEYWFDDPAQVRKWEAALRGALLAKP